MEEAQIFQSWSVTELEPLHDGLQHELRRPSLSPAQALPTSTSSWHGSSQTSSKRCPWQLARLVVSFGSDSGRDLLRNGDHQSRIDPPQTLPMCLQSACRPVRDLRSACLCDRKCTPLLSKKGSALCGGSSSKLDAPQASTSCWQCSPTGRWLDCHQMSEARPRSHRGGEPTVVCGVRRWATLRGCEVWAK